MKHVALITGASSGIGKELALIHAKKGKDLVLVARRKNRLQKLQHELQEKYNVEVIVLDKDLSVPASPVEIFEETESRGIKVEYLINNAGFAGFGYVHERPLKDDLDMVNVNITALMLLTKLYLPGMIARGRGKILNVSSSASFLPGPLQATYYATKAFVTSFSQAIAEELKDKGVTVTAFCPGIVDTEFVESSGMGTANIMKFQHAANPVKTAMIGYNDMLQGKLLSFDSSLMKFSLRWIIHFIPRRLLLNLSRKVMEKRKTVH